jgi:hypothetical protein
MPALEVIPPPVQLAPPGSARRARRAMAPAASNA